METLIQEFLSISIEPKNDQLYSSSAGTSITSGDGAGVQSGGGNLNGSGYGRGDKAFNGMGWDDFIGDGCGKPRNIKTFNNNPVYQIDLKQVIITKLLNPFLAQGFILNQDFQLDSCYIAKGNNSLALGKTVQEAQLYIEERKFDHLTENERFNLFVDKFPELDVPYNAIDIFMYHHVLTGSCAKGRIDFLKTHEITQETTGTIREFFELLKIDYSRGSTCINKLLKIYGERKTRST